MERAQHLRGFVAISGYENELYNNYKWDSKASWQVHTTAAGRAYTDTNNMAGKEANEKKTVATEVLWIREAKG